MSSATVALVSALLKDQYTQREVYWEAYKNNPELATVAKDEKFVGNVKQVAIQIETPQGGGVTVALAQSHLLPGSYKRFTLTRAQDFSFVRVDDQAMRAADTEDGSLVKLWTREMDGGILTIKRQWAVMFWRSGTGSRHGCMRRSAHSSPPPASSATGKPSSTATCKGKLCALSKISQKRVPASGVSYSAMKWA